MSTGSFNSLDHHFWDCEFHGCYIGVTNKYSISVSNASTAGAGNFVILRSFFNGSISSEQTEIFLMSIGQINSNNSFTFPKFPTPAPSGGKWGIYLNMQDGNPVLRHTLNDVTNFGGNGTNYTIPEPNYTEFQSEMEENFVRNSFAQIRSILSKPSNYVHMNAVGRSVTSLRIHRVFAPDCGIVVLEGK